MLIERGGEGRGGGRNAFSFVGGDREGGERETTTTKKEGGNVGRLCRWLVFM
jgi:hypothetical protein